MYRLLFVLVAALAASYGDQLSDHSDIDNGQCIPIKCSLGIPPEACTRQCALKHYVPTCQSPADLCLCQRLVGNSIQLVSPDEVLDQPSIFEVHTYSFSAVLVPIKNFFFESSEEIYPRPSAESLSSDGYGSVNVHEGRLFWDFRYILTGLFLLMVCLVVYELVMCRVQNYSRPEADEIKGKIVIM